MYNYACNWMLVRATTDLNFSKVFDFISHNILLEKLAVHGLDKCNPAFSWVKSWLDSQAQRVPTGHEWCSSQVSIEAGSV